MLALTDLPIVVTRTYTFLVLRSTDAAATLGLGGLDQFSTDLLLYTLASVVANGACTPLEVVRTRLLLQRSAPPGAAGATSYTGVLATLTLTPTPTLTLTLTPTLT